MVDAKLAPIELEDLLYSTLMVPNYHGWVTLLGYIIAMTSLCGIFDGGSTDIIVTDISTVLYISYMAMGVA